MSLNWDLEIILWEINPVIKLITASIMHLSDEPLMIIGG